MSKSGPAPATPLNVGKASYLTFSPPPAPRTNITPLLKCLQLGNVDQARACFSANPEAASQLYFDGGFEPALCCAVRLGCHPEMVQMLLQQGADAGVCDKRGFSPMTSLASMSAVRNNWYDYFLSGPTMAAVHREAARTRFRRSVEVARLLIQGGAHPKAVDARGRSPGAVARAGGNHELGCFFDNYLEVQASIVLLRASDLTSPLSRSDVLQVVLGHLLPADLVLWSNSFLQGRQ
jgi:hypothetical protein